MLWRLWFVDLPAACAFLLVPGLCMHSQDVAVLVDMLRDSVEPSLYTQGSCPN